MKRSTVFRLMVLLALSSSTLDRGAGVGTAAPGPRAGPEHVAASLAQPPAFILKWGTRGSADGQFDLPRRLAVDAEGNVFVSDRNNERIQKFTGAGVFLTKWGSLGSGDGQFSFPFGVDVDAQGFVYVAERSNHRIQKFTSEGVFVTKWGTFGAGEGEFNFPVAVTAGPDGTIYVGDSFNHRIQRFTNDGVFLGAWGALGAGEGEFNLPIGIRADAQGNVYVGDSGNDRVQKFNRHGAFLTTWGTPGESEGQFDSPRGIGIDAAGCVYVADFGNSRIQVFTSEGAFLTAWGTFGSGDGQFSRPEDVDVDASGFIFVADAANNRVQKFGPAIVPVTLRSFTGERAASGVRLRWQLADPSAFDVAFEVLRAIPGETPRAITAAPLTGSLQYEHLDSSPPRGEVLYWLRELSEAGEYMHGPLSIAAAPALRLDIASVVPNPFSRDVTIELTLPGAGRARLLVIDAAGRIVAEILDQTVPSGPHAVSWAPDRLATPIPSGVYFLRLEAGGDVTTRKITIVR